MSSFNPSTFFIHSLEPWGAMWYSKHHYAAQLARQHKVYFVSVPARWRWKYLFSTRAWVKTTPEGVNVVEYHNNLPLNILPPWMRSFIARINARKLRRLARTGDVVHWCFHPTMLLNGPTLRGRNVKVIYHVVDPYQTLPNDSYFAENADLVVAINPWYLKYYRQLNRNCILIPHGVRPEDRVFDPGVVAAHRSKWGRYMILATGVNKFVNYKLLLLLARRFPEVNILIAGQLFRLGDEDQKTLRDELFSLGNVHYIGIKHPDDLKHLIRGAALGLLTYDFEVTRSVPVAAGRTPLKVLTYLAQSCPVVSTNNSYVNAVDGRGYYKAEHSDHFLTLVDKILSGTIGVEVDAVEAYMDSVEYARLVDLILEVVSGQIAITAEAGATHEQAQARAHVPEGAPILIVSNEEWNGPRYSKHRYAIALSAQREVFFIDPAPQWRPSHLFRTRIRRASTPEGVVVLSYFNVVPLFGGSLGGINDLIISRRIRQYLSKIGRKDPVLWTFDPSRLVNPRLLGTSISIYHCADDHAFRMKGEKLLARRCDHVFCIARDLMPRFQALNSSVSHVPHGVSQLDMEPELVDVATLPAAPGFGLYIGNINDRHDFKLWEKAFERFSDVTWVVVGPINVTDGTGIRLLKSSPPANVVCLGPTPYPELRQLISAAGFGFLYMNPGNPANRIASQKVVQFLALGKPFFCSWFSEYEDKQDIVYMSDDHDTAMAQLEHWFVHGEPAQVVSRRLEHAEHLRFEHLIKQLPFTI